MDERSENSGKRHALRSSLVERAAEKIATASGVATPRDQEPEPAAPLEPTAPPVALERLEESAVTKVEVEVEPPPGDVLEKTLRVAATADTPSDHANEKSAAIARRQKSKLVKIDTGAFAAHNILTPQSKRSRTVEEFRLIKRMVLSRRWDEGEAPGNTIIITSALPSEGKTTTAINLAMSIAAEEDLRVLLIDADFIKPDALNRLGVSSAKGLIDVIENPRLDISDVMLRTNIDKLSLIPAGRLHDRCTELLASARMDELITELANRYEDRILIFDSPPILVTTESVTLASHMGQVLLVVEAGRTKRESLNSALELIGDQPHLGLVLNRTSGRLGNVEFGSYYGSYYYKYGGKG